MTDQHPVEEVHRTRRQLVLSALNDAAAEYGMGGVPARAMKADEVLAIAARNHVRAIDALPLRPVALAEVADQAGAVLVGEGTEGHWA